MWTYKILPHTNIIHVHAQNTKKKFRLKKKIWNSIKKHMKTYIPLSPVKKLKQRTRKSLCYTKLANCLCTWQRRMQSSLGYQRREKAFLFLILRDFYNNNTIWTRGGQHWTPAGIHKIATEPTLCPIYIFMFCEVWRIQSALHTSGAYCIKLLPEKNSGYFNHSVFPMVKSMVNSMLTWVFRVYLGFSLVKVLCNTNRPLVS